MQLGLRRPFVVSVLPRPLRRDGKNGGLEPSQGERVLYGGNLCGLGGAGKAEAAEPPGAGIGPKRCLGNEWQKKGPPTELVTKGEPL